MSVSIVAKCDGCGREKTLKISETGRSRDIHEAVINEAWTPALDVLLFCPQCIQSLVEKKSNVKWRNS